MPMNNPNNISINGRFLTQTVTGVQRCAIEILKSLDKLIANEEVGKLKFKILAPKTVDNPKLAINNIPIHRVGRKSGHLWEQLELPYYSKGDALFNFCNTAPIFKKKQAVTIHDASVFSVPFAYPREFYLWYRIMHKNLGRFAKVIMTDSLFSKSELIKYCGIPEEKIHVLYPSGDHISKISSDDTILSKYNLSEKPYIFAVSSMSPHKNFHSLVKAVELIQNKSFDVVIAGGINPKVFTKSKSLPQGTKYLGYVSDEELKSLYQNAACFVYPSFYEGFGMPPIEAMSCGCPVIVSNAASLPEICGDSAVYCDPHNPEDMAGEIDSLVNDVEMQNRLRSEGYSRAKVFSWNETARKIVQIYHEVLESKS